MRARGFVPLLFTNCSEATTTAAAPSESCEAFPAVTVPSGRNAGRSFASPSAVVSARMPGQHTDHVPALPSAQADQADVPGGRTFELGAQVPLHEFPPLREQGAWIVVVPVPFHPVTLHHSATLQSAVCRHQSRA